MQFISMEVNRQGSSDQLQFGKLSQGLNAICGPNGSGKTTLLNWLRLMTVESSSASPWSDPSPAMQAPQYGTVELCNQQAIYKVVKSANGQVSCHSSGGFDRADYQSHAAHVLTPDQQRAFNELTSIQQGVDNVRRLEALAQHLGFDQPAVDHSVAERQALLTRQTEIHTRLRALEGLRSTREGLLSRRGQLEADLHRAQRDSQTQRGYSSLGDRERLEEQRSALATELRDVRTELGALERDIAGHKSGWSLRRGQHELDIGSTYREQLEQLDARLDRWRQTLRDLRAHRERLEHDATDARLDKQIGDQLSITKTAEPRVALRSLEAQLLNASQQLEALIDRNDRTYESYHAQASLPESLRNMQRDLYEVCQQLARQESATAAETLRQQATQLARSEAELLQSVEKLIDERAALLHKIADEYHLSMDQLTLAFGDWCECHDHPHLSQWLLNETPGAHSHHLPEQSVNEFYSEDNRVWEQRRVALQNRIADLQTQLKEIESQLAVRRQPEQAKPARTAGDVARDLDKVVVELRDLEERDQLRVELDELRRALAKRPTATVAENRFQQLVNRHLAGLLGTPPVGSVDHSSGHRFTREHRFGNGAVSKFAQRPLYNETKATLTNGTRLGLPATPTAMVELAMRLAIAEAMLERRQPISLLVDGPLDHVTAELQQSAMRHLESVASTGQQIVVFSSDERIAELVRCARGWVGYMRAWKVVRPTLNAAFSTQKPAYDVNRQLLAFANDHEADKWYEPAVPKQRTVKRTHVTSRYRQLTEASLIEDCPTLDATCAARCRALGIDRIGDLLATDPHWLAEHLKLSGVSSSTVMRWQTESKLLCGVPQLRPFDARVLAGAGVRHPRQLAEMHPSQLLDRVERFLATDRGRDILRSGNSYELSRITSWIASAKNGDVRSRSQSANSHRAEGSSTFDESQAPRATVSYRPPREARPSYDYDADFAANAEEHAWQNEAANNRPARESMDLPQTYSERGRESTRAIRPTRTAATSYPVVPREYESQDLEQRPEPELRDREPSESQRADRLPRSPAPRDVRKPRQTSVVRGAVASDKNGRQGAVVAGARFYLDLSSPVVEAPSIGPRVAEKLELIGIRTVQQFLTANADSIAPRLETKRVDADTVRDWQDQARMVCRIPNLRGHDAQLLVACRVTSPELLSNMNASTLLAQVTAIANSSEGQRMLRGSQAPDLAEVTDWINWSNNSRSLNAA